MRCIFLLFLVLFQQANAQDFTITGVVADAANEPLTFANVVVQTVEGKVLYGATTDVAGRFLIAEIPKGTYLIVASYIEGTSKPQTISITADLDIGVLRILNDTQVLDEVVVMSQKPTLEQKADRYVFTVKNSALTETNIWNLLKRTPGVVIVNNRLMVNNTGNIGVLINGRKVNIPEADLINLLSGSSASSVESIEVITAPPAKYSAEGGLLINIKMKNNLIAGYNGAVYNRYTQGVFAKHTFGTDHFFKGKKTDFSLAYAYKDNKSLERYTDVTTFFNTDNQPDAVWAAELRDVTNRKEHNVNAFLDYQLNDRNTISISTINTLAPSIESTSFSNTTIVSTSGVANGGFETKNASDNDFYNLALYLDWVHKFKKEGAQLAFNTHYTFYNNNRQQDIDTDFFDANATIFGQNDFITQSGRQTGLFSIQTDYSATLNKISQWEAGLRFAAIKSDNTINQEGFDRSQPGMDPTEIGEFIYDEAISAAYLNMNNSWDAWKFNVGMRAEHTKTTSTLDTNVNSYTNDYLSWFPSLSLLYTHKKKHAFKFNYFRRITRPRYAWLNPFQYFQSNNTVIEGNPNLLPTIRNNLSLGYTFNNSLTFTAFYHVLSDEFFQQLTQDNAGNLLRFIAANLDTNTSYGLDANYYKRVTDRWSTYVMFNNYYKENNFIDLETGLMQQNNAWITQFRTIQSYRFLEDKSLFADATFTYMSPTVRGNAAVDAISMLGFYVSKSLWNKKASISLTAEDIFNQGNMFYARQYLNQNNTSSVRLENRLVVLGFRYSFGNTNIRNNKKRKNTEERDRI